MAAQSLGTRSVLRLPVLTAVTQWGIQRMMAPPSVDPQQAQMNRAMQIMPLMFLFFSLQFPSGLVLYWVTSNLVSFVQQYFLTGWGGLFPGGYKPVTPFAGSWEPGENWDGRWSWTTTPLTLPMKSRGPAMARLPRRRTGSGDGPPRGRARRRDAVRSVESHGKTVDEAIAQALRRLGRQRDDVEITVLSEGSRGVFGIGAEHARVRVTLREGDENEPRPAAAEDAVSLDRLGEIAQDMLMDILELMGIEGEVSVRSVDADADSPNVLLDVEGEDLGVLISGGEHARRAAIPVDAHGAAPSEALGARDGRRRALS